MACCQTSGVVRMDDIRRITPLSEVLWQPPHLAIVSGSFTGIGFWGMFDFAAQANAAVDNKRDGIVTQFRIYLPGSNRSTFRWIGSLQYREFWLSPYTGHRPHIAEGDRRATGLNRVALRILLVRSRVNKLL